MTEMKFKLKKAGKRVGYIRIAPWGTAPMQVAYLWAEDTQWEPACRFVFDSIHPFVCKDRNGQDVYEGDSVRVFLKDVTETSTVRMDDEWHQFRLVNDDGSYGWHKTDIELIPDEQEAI